MVKIKTDLKDVRICLHLECHVDWSLKKEEVRRGDLGFVL